MRPMRLAFRNPALFSQIFYRYYFRRLFPNFTGWNRPLAPVESLIFHNAFDTRFEVDSRELGDSNGVRQMARGCYEIYLQNIFCRVLRLGDIFIDVGANAGFFSVYAASLVGPAGQVHSFEPASRYFRILQRNAQLNPDIQFTINNLAVSDKAGEAVFYPAAPTHSGGSSLEAGWLAKSHRDPEETVRIVTLSEYLEDKGLGAVRLIKIDVEGHEAAAMQGLAGYLRKVSSLPFIICETTGDKSLRVVRKILEELGYEIRDVYNPGRRLKDTAGHVSLDIFAVPPPATHT